MRQECLHKETPKVCDLHCVLLPFPVVVQIPPMSNSIPLECSDPDAVKFWWCGPEVSRVPFLVSEMNRCQWPQKLVYTLHHPEHGGPEVPGLSWKQPLMRCKGWILCGQSKGPVSSGCGWKFSHCNKNSYSKSCFWTSSLPLQGNQHSCKLHNLLQYYV